MGRRTGGWAGWCHQAGGWVGGLPGAWYAVTALPTPVCAGGGGRPGWAALLLYGGRGLPPTELSAALLAWWEVMNNRNVPLATPGAIFKMV